MRWNTWIGWLLGSSSKWAEGPPAQNKVSPNLPLRRITWRFYKNTESQTPPLESK